MTADRCFYVQVLATERGHYVGHTASPTARLDEHRHGKVRSTRGANPRVAWLSDPMETREEAERFAKSLTLWRDQRSQRFLDTTGVAPEPWR